VVTVWAFAVTAPTGLRREGPTALSMGATAEKPRLLDVRPRDELAQYYTRKAHLFLSEQHPLERLVDGLDGNPVREDEAI
jgi:hypothetical protein